MSDLQRQDRLKRLFRLAGNNAEGRYLLALMARHRGVALP